MIWVSAWITRNLSFWALLVFFPGAWGVVTTTPTPAPQILSFKEWKAARVEETQKVIDKMSADAASAPKSLPSTATKSGRGVKLQQAIQNAEIAQDLTVNDYFVLYLSQFHTRDVFVDVAKRLAPEELADLMLAFQKSLVNTPPDLSNPMMSKAK